MCRMPGLGNGTSDTGKAGRDGCARQPVAHALAGMALAIPAGPSLPPQVSGPVVGELELHVPLVGASAEASADLAHGCSAALEWWGAAGRDAFSALRPRSAAMTAVAPPGKTRAGWEKRGSSDGQLSTHRGRDNTVIHPIMASMDGFLRYCQDMVRGPDRRVRLSQTARRLNCVRCHSGQACLPP